MGIFDVSAGIDVFPWGAHFSMTDGEESESEWVLWHQALWEGDEELAPQSSQENQESSSMADEPPERGTETSETTYRMGYGSDTEVRTRLTLPGNPWEHGELIRGDVRVNLYRAGELEFIRLEQIWVNVTDNLGVVHQVASLSPDETFENQGWNQSYPVEFTAGVWEDPLDVTAETRLILQRAEPQGQPDWGEDTANYWGYNASFESQEVYLDVNISTPNDTWRAGDSYPVSVQVTLREVDNVDRVDVTEMLLQQDFETITSTDEVKVLSQQGDTVTYSFDIEADSVEPGRILARPGFKLHLSDGDTEERAPDESGVAPSIYIDKYGPGDLVSVMDSGYVDSQFVFFAEPMEPTTSDGPGSENEGAAAEAPFGEQLAWLLTILGAQGLFLVGTVLGAASLVGTVRSRGFSRRSGVLGIWAGSLLLGGSLAYTIGLDRLVKSAIGPLFDWSFGLLLGLLAGGMLLAGGIFGTVAAGTSRASSAEPQVESISYSGAASQSTVSSRGGSRTQTQPGIESGGRGTGQQSPKRAKCPRCKSVVTIENPSRPVCPECGHGRGGG